MEELCIKVSDDIKKKISKFSKLALAKIFERALKLELENAERQNALEKLENLSKDSKLTDEDCLNLGKDAKKDFYKRLKIEGKA